jgi:hypothetical protein
MIRVILISLLFGATLPATATSQGKRWERQVRGQLDRTLSALQGAARAQTRIVSAGPLNTEESDSFDVGLIVGKAYDVVAVCDEDCTGLHLVLSTARGNDMAVDRSSENLPVLHFTPSQSASYRIKVTMAACRLNPCWYGVALRGS